MQCSSMQGLYARLTGEDLYIWFSDIQGIYAELTAEHQYIYIYIYTCNVHSVSRAEMHVSSLVTAVADGRSTVYSYHS